jgi:hypothetical protein
MEIWEVTIGPPHPIASRKRQLIGGGPLDETGETEHRCGTVMIPSCSKALSTDHRPKFCSPSPVMVESPISENS